MKIQLSKQIEEDGKQWFVVALYDNGVLKGDRNFFGTEQRAREHITKVLDQIKTPFKAGETLIEEIEV